MKRISIFFAGFSGLLLAGLFLGSCTKTFDEKTVRQTDFSNSSIVQVYVATVNATRNWVYMDGGPITGSLLSSGSVFPTTGYGASIPGGLRSFLVRDTLNTSTQVPLAFSQNLSAGKTYTIFMYDTINSPKQKTVITNIDAPTDTTARLRFANFVYNPTDPGRFDIFSKVRNANVFTNVGVTDVTDFIPYASAITDTFLIRQAGTTTNLQNRNPTTGAMSDVQAILTPTQKRSYTLVFRGGFRASATTATTVRTLSVFANR